MILTKEELDNLSPMTGNILIKLPDNTGADSFKHKSGLIISTTLSDQYQYHPVHGTVIKSSGVSKVGDDVFYHYLTYDNAKSSNGSMLIESGKQYMIMSERDLIFIKRGEELIAMNGHVLLKKIKSKGVESITLHSPMKSERSVMTNVSISSGGILIPEEAFEPRMAEVVVATPEANFKKGDTVAVVMHFDVQVENELMNSLPDPIYYLQQDYAIKIEKKEDKWQPVL